MSSVFCAALISVMRLVKASSALPTRAKPESLRVPAEAARVSTARPSRVSEGLASAVEIGLSISLGKEAQPVSQKPKSSRHSHRELPERWGAGEEKVEAGRSAAAVMGMMQATLA
jgi:hypothetical protein